MNNLPRYLVVETEYERGWGSRDFAAKEFDCLESAKSYVDSVNAENTLPVVPDYYIVARLITDPRLIQKYSELL
jgi:hypothetical protein